MDGQSLALITIRDVYGSDSLAAIPVITRTDGTAPATPLVSGGDNYYKVELSRDGLWTVLRADETGKSGAMLSRCTPAAAPAIRRCVGPRRVRGPARAPFSVAGYRAARNRPQYDVSPDGQRFLMIRENTASQVVYVENWFAELLAKAKR